MSDELFIYWRLYPSKELDRFWDEFITKNDHLKTPFEKAIEEFESINNLPAAKFETKTLRELKEIERINTISLIGEKQINGENQISGVNHATEDKITWEHQVSEKNQASGKNQFSGKNQVSIDNQKSKKAKPKIIYYITSAAAVALIALITTLYFTDIKKSESEPEVASIGEVMPDNSVQLYSGNRVMALDNNSALKISGKDKTALIEDADSDHEMLLDNVSNRLVVPYGHRSSILLSDGSMVYLNSGTTIEFPTEFDNDKREISVSGEIFIEVEKDEKKPFIIRTPKSIITVHGTSFNLSSYADEMSESVVLLEGSVEIENSGSSLLLKPNQKAEFAEGKILCKNIDVSEYISWMKGYLELNNIPLTDLLMKISRYYNVKFRFSNEMDLSVHRCMGKLFLSDNLDDVLDAFTNLTHLSYEKESDSMIYINDLNIEPMKRLIE